MIILEEGCLLRIFISESDQKDNIQLYKWLVIKAKEEGLAGATVLQGMKGFGVSGEIRKPHIFKQTLPIIIEIADSSEKIEKFLHIIDDVITTGLVTLKNIPVRLYPKKPSGT